jgi:hypothetical protein
VQSYNGYTPTERMKKARAAFDAMVDGAVGEPWPPCTLCGDPEVTCYSHSEDYSEPYRWHPPAMYSICGPCHARLHKRFSRPDRWEAFKAHVRRGGYASDLKNPTLAKELASYVKAKAGGRATVLRPMRPYSKGRGKEWWDRLSTDSRTLRAPSARPRA